MTTYGFPRYVLHFVLLICMPTLSAQMWYLDISTGELQCIQKGGERFAEKGLLAVAKGNYQELTEQLPHALDCYGIEYDYEEDGLRVYVSEIYKTWRLMQAGEDIQMALGVLMLADLFAGIEATQTRIVGSLFRNGFSRGMIRSGSELWQLPAVHRGVEIENLRAGGHRLPNGFPVVDVFRNGTAISVKSVDITLQSYQGVRLLYRLKGYVNKLIRFRGAAWGGRTVRGNVKKELEVVIPKGKATDLQKKFFDQVVEYGKSNNISVKFIEL